MSVTYEGSFIEFFIVTYWLALVGTGTQSVAADPICVDISRSGLDSTNSTG